MINKKIFLTAAALVLVAGISVKPAMAYFTDTESASGTVTISIGDAVLDPTDTGDGTSLTKTVSVANTSEYECYIRVKAIAGKNYTITMVSGDWTKDGDYYVYNQIVPAGGSTSDIVFSITMGNVKDQTFNVVIVEEATKVHYKSDGTPFANWTEKIVSHDAVGTTSVSTNETTTIQSDNATDTEEKEGN